MRKGPELRSAVGERVSIAPCRAPCSSSESSGRLSVGGRCDQLSRTEALRQSRSSRGRHFLSVSGLRLLDRPGAEVGTSLLSMMAPSCRRPPTKVGFHKHTSQANSRHGAMQLVQRRNGTIGWRLAGGAREHGAQPKSRESTPEISNGSSSKWSASAPVSVPGVSADVSDSASARCPRGLHV